MLKDCLISKVNMFGMLTVAAVFLSSCKKISPESEVLVRGTNRGQLKGPATIRTIIGTRLGAGIREFDLFNYTHETAPFSQLGNIMGSFASEGIKNRYANGAPNSVNMFLWEKVLTNVGRGLASEACLSDKIQKNIGDSDSPIIYLPFSFSLEAKQIMGHCGPIATGQTARLGPNQEGVSTIDSQNLWSLLMEQDAPVEEYQAWTKWLESPAFQSAYKTAEDRLAAAIAGAWLNPYFLLEN